MNPRPPLPLFTEETARQKVQMAEDAWKSLGEAVLVLAGMRGGGAGNWRTLRRAGDSDKLLLVEF